ncbi:DUF4040 domain-containing protein [Leptolyngbya sp. BC1307]|uniref:DUF4040 domain-containing protein n=1 Tax=Leptolyngbya sp. BC1307 TaxID=2029589 RepID=UPI000EFACEE4|nr:DUF4040 domain-containing protein [Leptolyngbya sp. BC1307]
MSEDFYLIAITALLPLTACLLVLQVNPYHALVVRGILGAIAALVYALFGAADVALTEALVGTMLSITLYAVAVRSSLNMKLGVLDADSKAEPATVKPILSALRERLRKYHMQLELVPYPSRATLSAALANREIHTALSVPLDLERERVFSSDRQISHLQTRVRRLYDIMQAELPPDMVKLTYVNSAIASQTDSPQLDTLTTVED